MVSLIVCLLVAGVLMFVVFILQDIKENTRLKIGLGAAALVFTIAGIVSYPLVNIWQKQLSGEALLREAEWSRQIKVKESEAFLESSKNFAMAEVERAKGADKANRIVADGLGGPQGYLRYLFIEGLKIAHENGNQIIYIPTEAAMPIQEAARLTKAQQ